MDNKAYFEQLLSREIQQFILDHENDDEKSLLLKHREIMDVPTSYIAQQLVGRKKAKTKLPTYYDTPGILYPPKLNLEQCSSESTAFFKSNLVTGKVAVDLTGGFGVDSYFLSKNFEKVIHVDIDESLVQLVRHNHTVLGADNIIHNCSNAESYLASANTHFDLIYIDPSRRSNANRKVFKLADCSPNILKLLPLLLAKANVVLIKASPIIDIQQALRELNVTARVYVVGFDNECKEVLFHVTKAIRETTIEVVDLSVNKVKPFSFKPRDEAEAEVFFSEPLQYLYEPTAMILKAGAFRLLAKRFQLKKLAPSTHLYTSDKIIPDFPGRVFRLEKFFKADTKSSREVLPDGYANIFTRNYPLTPSQLKKKLKTEDGGEKFVIGFSGRQKKYIALAQRVK